jgi:tetratricopeptide (TPR) repeat protein
MIDASFSDQDHGFSNAQNWFNHGCDLCDLEQYEQAIAAFDKVIELDSEHFEAWFNRAAILHRLKRDEEAIASYTRAIEINPDYSSAWLNRGNAFWHLERYAEALEDYDKVVELEPSNPNVWHGRTCLLNALQRYDEAEVSNARWISINAKLYPSLAIPQHKLQAVDEPVVIDRHTDFTKAFRDGYTFYRDFPHFGISEVTFSTYELGELNLTSGHIVTCDPSIEEAYRCPFIQCVEPGQYPVFLSVAYEEISGYANIACAMIRFREEAAIRWELAQIHVPGSSGSGEVYGVDSGKGCFMDVDAAEVLFELRSYSFQEKADINTAWLTGDTRQTNEAIGVAIDRSWNRFQQEFDDRLNAEMDSNEIRPPGQLWANIQVSNSTQANIVAFSSGYGDGAYVSYWGYDAAGNLVSLVTDFALFPSWS